MLRNIFVAKSLDFHCDLEYSYTHNSTELSIEVQKGKNSCIRYDFETNSSQLFNLSIKEKDSFQVLIYNTSEKHPKLMSKINKKTESRLYFNESKGVIVIKSRQQQNIHIRLSEVTDINKARKILSLSESNKKLIIYVIVIWGGLTVISALLYTCCCCIFPNRAI